ncbi:MAG: NAD(P)H-dependent oxidoreductase subunit E [Rhodobacteraceae bacterium]|nr:NAD(P)H-dependent oxidoreductase subunit E [Paracoccaceae bacterium]
MAMGDHQGVWKSTTRKGRRTPKGRQLDDSALEDIRVLLNDRPRRRDLLIEHLHLIQDHYGHLSARHIRALAEEMRLSMAEIYEVATFYAHFDVVRESENPPPPLTLRVCDSLSCELAGAQDLIANLRRSLDPATVRVVRAPCIGRCDTAPTLEMGHNHIDHATPERVHAALAAGETAACIPDYERFSAYCDAGGYACLRDIRRNGDFATIQRRLLDAGIRGLGGAGFPTGKKWEFVRAEPGPRYLAVNGDEGEPGTFKDRYYLERTPHLFLEGMLVGAWAVKAETCFIYMRDEYPAVLEILRREIAELESAGLVTQGYIELRRGAGAYICGEESAMIESIEGKRGLPRHRPPFVAQVGLFGRPTLVNNVETLYWVARVLREGIGVLADVSQNGRTGLRSYSVSGRVRNPGVYLLPAGSTMTDILEACGGMAEGHRFKAYQPGGPSAGILPSTLADIPLDFDVLQEFGTFIGSAAIVVLSDRDSIRDVALNMLRFFEDESCGQCTPCRVGCEKAVKLMQEPVWDWPLLKDLCDTMMSASICGLGQAAANPILLTKAHFPEDVGCLPEETGHG